MRRVPRWPVLVLILCFSGCSLLSENDDALQFDGVVTHIEIEGGAWVISRGDETYEPINLADEYKQEDLRVRVWAERREDLASFLMVGPIIEIKRIRPR